MTPASSTNRLSDELLSAFAGARVLVAGDAMLDEYLWGEATRLCPEAPVPVVRTRRRSARPGGAANAAANLAALGATTYLAAVVGADPAAEALRGTLTEAGVDPAGLLADAGRPTTTKTRVLAQNQQVLRIDAETAEPLPTGLADRLVHWVDRHLDRCTACLLCDYDKGVLGAGTAGRLIEAARRQGVPVVVDPKGTDYERYRGATVIKPNQRELAEALGRPVPDSRALRSAGAEMASRLPGITLLVTRGADGLALFHDDQPPRFLPAAPAHGVYDVTGAGDTVAAVLALGLAAGAPLACAAALANAAAAVVVGKPGTAVPTLDELRAALAAGIPEFPD